MKDKRLMNAHRQLQHRALWTAALIILGVGGFFIYLFSMNRNDPASQMGFSVSIAATILGVGLCVILATADWWLKR